MLISLVCELREDELKEVDGGADPVFWFVVGYVASKVIVIDYVIDNGPYDITDGGIVGDIPDIP